MKVYKFVFTLENISVLPESHSPTSRIERPVDDPLRQIQKTTKNEQFQLNVAMTMTAKCQPLHIKYKQTWERNEI